METIADRLKYARDLKGWSQAKLALLSDVSTGTIGNIESGARQSKGSLPQIAEALGVNHKWLSIGKGPMQVAAATGSAVPVDLENNPDYPSIRRVQFKLSAGVSGFDYTEQVKARL